MSDADLDAKILQDLLNQGMTEEEASDALSNIRKLRKEQKKESELPTGSVRPSFPSKKATPIVKTARAGGMMRSIDGIAQRGKTRAKRK